MITTRILALLLFSISCHVASSAAKDDSVKIFAVAYPIVAFVLESVGFPFKFPSKEQLLERTGLTDYCSLGEERCDYLPCCVSQVSSYRVMSFQPAIYFGRRS